MKTRTANNDRYASADLDYQASLCFQAVAENLDYSCQENDTSIYDGMLRDISLFIDMLEIVKMAGISSAGCFKKAFEGLVEGMVYDLAINYDVYDDNYPIEKFMVKLKKRVYRTVEKNLKKQQAD